MYNNSSNNKYKGYKMKNQQTPFKLILIKIMYLTVQIWTTIKILNASSFCNSNYNNISHNKFKNHNTVRDALIFYLFPKMIQARSNYSYIIILFY